MLAFPGGIFAQNLNYKIVDSTSYALYTQQQWVKLIKYGELANSNGIDYYYLNLRLGIAWFNAGDYYKAQKYFDRALKQNQNEQTANEYLYLIKTLINRLLSADINYNSLIESTRNQLDSRSPYFIPSIYFEAGIKFSKDKNIENNEPLFRFLLDQKITRRFNLGVSASYIGQHNAVWGTYNQLEFGLIPTIAIGSNSILNLGWRYMNSNINRDGVNESVFRESTPIQNEIGNTLLIVDSTVTDKDNSNNIRNVNAFFAGIEQYYGRFSFFGQGLIYIQNNDLNTDKTISTIVDKRIVIGNSVISRETANEIVIVKEKSNFINYYYQIMIGTTYTFPVFNEGIKIGLSTYIPLNDSFSKSVWIPTLSLRLSERLWFYGEWLQKKDIPLLYQNGNIYLNQTYELNHRITLGLNYRKSDKTQWYFTYLNEDKYYFSDETNNRFNSFIIGVNLNF